ncbi:DUF6801 domain-containing protein [Actinophytocola sp. NPDC049390]|uniref:DUF6801 domain-containing protein n=1 Tax=Actinophytocola sp. NPDC049390 TaxID=3363894 RepID=UPI0037B87BAE
MRRNRRALVIAGVAISLVVVPGNAGAQREPLHGEPQVIDTSLDYVCGEAGPVTLRVTATLPAAGVVGAPVEPVDVGLAVTVPATALAGLPGAASVTAVTRLDVHPERWSAVSDPVPLADPVVLGGTVTAPPVTPPSAGQVTFAAGDLTVAITGYAADGTPTEPPVAGLTCVLDPAETAELAVVPVGAPPRTPERVPSPAPEEPGQPDRGAPSATAPSVAAPPPPECYRLPDTPPVYRTPFCAKVNGRANIAKLDAAVYQPTGTINIAATNLMINRCPEKPPVGCQDALVLPELDGEPKYPPATGSFFAFGFVPATGTMQLTQIGLADVHQWSKLTPIPGRPGEYEGLTKVNVKLSAQIIEARVNGVPVPVGPDCRSAVPIDAVFTASYSGPDKYSITKGGPLMGTVTIPPFSGCGVTEDLDPILTGLISGPGNHVRLYQGPVCAVTGNNSGCPPAEPVDPKYPAP